MHSFALHPLAVCLLPLGGAGLLWLQPAASASHVRRVCVAAALLTLTAAMALAARFALDPPQSHALPAALAELAPERSHVAFALDNLSALLVPVTSALALCILWGCPSGEMTSRPAARSLVALSMVLGTLLSVNLLWLALFWTASLLPLYLELRSTRSVAARSYRIMLVLCIVPIWALVGALCWPGVLHPAVAAGDRFDMRLLSTADAFSQPKMALLLGSLVLVALLCRVGCFPLHLWISPLSAHGSGPLSLVTYSTPLGIFVLTRLLLPVFPNVCQLSLPRLLPLAVLSALYGAIVGLGQRDCRRALGYFWMSQQGFLLAGISALSVEGLSGALLHALATVIVRTGLVIIVLSVAARTGTTDVRRLGGLALRAPRMSAAFLVLSVAAIGIPGTIGFVSEDLIVQGLVRQHPIEAVMLLVTTGLNGILLFRLHHGIFLGPASSSPRSAHTADFADQLPRERWVSLALIGLLLTGGVISTPLLAVRRNVIQSLQTTGVLPLLKHHATPRPSGP